MNIPEEVIPEEFTSEQAIIIEGDMLTLSDLNSAIVWENVAERLR